MRVALLALLAGCPVPDPGDDKGGETSAPAPVDADGDGLTAEVEAALGTDDTKLDSDGDGWDDAVEVEGHADPADAGDHPYTGGWPMDACRHDVPVGDGILPDYTFADRYGETVRLHDFCEHTLWLVFAALW